MSGLSRPLARYHAPRAARNRTGEVETLFGAVGRSFPRGERPRPITRIVGSACLERVVAGGEEGAGDGGGGVGAVLPELRAQEGRLIRLVHDDVLLDGRVARGDRGEPGGERRRAGEPALDLPRRVRVDGEHDTKARALGRGNRPVEGLLILDRSGSLGSQRVVITDCLSFSPAIREKNSVPGPSVHFPVSSFAPTSAAGAALAAARPATATTIASILRTNSPDSPPSAPVLEATRDSTRRREMLEKCVEQATGAESHGVVGGEARLGLGGSDRRSSPVVVEVPRVQRNARDRGPSAGKRDPLVQVHESGEREEWVAGIPVDLGRAGPVAEDECVRCRSVHEAERHTRVARVGERALALDEKEVSPTSAALDDEPLRGAGDEVGDDCVDGDAPAGDSDARLARRYERGGDSARRGLAGELEGDGHLPDRTIRADREDDIARYLEIRAGRDLQIDRGSPQIAQGRTGGGSEGSELGVVFDELVQTVVDPDSVSDAFAQKLSPRGREPPADGRYADERGGRMERQRRGDIAHDRHVPLVLTDARRVENGHDVVRAVPQDAVHRLGPMRIAREALCEDQEASRRATRHRGQALPTAPAPRR